MTLNGGAGGGDSVPATQPAAVLPARFGRTAGRVEQALRAELERWLPEVPGRLAEAVRYALLGPGKRLRPVLLLWSAELCVPLGAGEPPLAGREKRTTTCDALPPAVAIELLHTYSLVHDDLPAMDDDELRRGRATCHVAFGEGLAILAGDALLTRAFEVLGQSALPAERIAALVRVLADAGGAAGMIGGQAEDLAHQRAGGDLSAVQSIHERKTAALFAAACRMGVLAVGGDEPAEEALGQFGRCLGLAFQIADDLLDETGRTEQLGKLAGKDRSAGKLTYPAVAGLPASRRAAAEWVSRAESALDVLGARPGTDRGLLDDFRALGRYVLERTR